MTTEILVPVKMKRVYCFLSFPLNAMKVLDRVPIWGLWKVNVSRQNGKGNKSQGSTEMAVSCPIFSSDLSMPEFKVSLTPGVYTGCTQISKKCHLFIVWCVGKGFSEWESKTFPGVSVCVCVRAHACFQPPQLQCASTAVHRNQQLGRHLKSEEGKHSLTRGTVL